MQAAKLDACIKPLLQIRSQGQEVTLSRILLTPWIKYTYVYKHVWLALSLGHLFCTKIIIKVAKWQSQSYML